MLSAAFSLINLALIAITLLLTFRGFPYAFISFAGYFLSMTAINTFLGVWINPGKEHQTYFTKILTSAIGVGLLLAGDWIINAQFLLSTLKIVFNAIFYLVNMILLSNPSRYIPIELF